MYISGEKPSFPSDLDTPPPELLISREFFRGVDDEVKDVLLFAIEKMIKKKSSKLTLSTEELALRMSHSKEAAQEVWEKNARTLDAFHFWPWIEVTIDERAEIGTIALGTQYLGYLSDVDNTEQGQNWFAVDHWMLAEKHINRKCIERVYAGQSPGWGCCYWWAQRLCAPSIARALHQIRLELMQRPHEESECLGIVRIEDIHSSEAVLHTLFV